MSFALSHRSILVTGAALMLCAGLSACGQKGPLYLPHTPAAAGRATLPQTVFGGGAKASAPAAVASAPLPAAPPSVLPNVPDIQ
jgi:predicted small lipoprotein YifL